MKKLARKMMSLLMAVFMVLQVILPAFASSSKAEDENPNSIKSVDKLEDAPDLDLSIKKSQEIYDKKKVEKDQDKFSIAVSIPDTSDKFRLVKRNDLKLFDDKYFETNEKASKEYWRVKDMLNDQGLDLDLEMIEDENGFKLIKKEELENKDTEKENPYGENYSYIEFKIMDDFDFNEKGNQKLLDEDKLIFNLELLQYESLDPDFNLYEKDQEGNLKIKNQGDIFALIVDDKKSLYDTKKLEEDYNNLKLYKEEKLQKEADQKAQKEAEEKAKKEAEEKQKEEEAKKAQEEKAKAEKSSSNKKEQSENSKEDSNKEKESKTEIKVESNETSNNEKEEKTDSNKEEKDSTKEEKSQEKKDQAKPEENKEEEKQQEKKEEKTDKKDQTKKQDLMSKLRKLFLGQEEPAKAKVEADQNSDSSSNLENKKFTIRTRFDTSTRQGPIKVGQHFDIKLDDKLMVKNPSSLEDIIHNGNVIAKASYNQDSNTIKYEIVRDIDEDINKLLNIDVDYNTANIPAGESFTVINSISGLGVTNPKTLPAEKIDKNGNPAGTIIEEGRYDVVQIIGEDDENYKVNMDILGNPVVDGNELSGINWTLRVDSTVDLVDLGYKLNLTTVEGSGLGEIQNVKINGKPVDLTDQLDGKLGISDSKHHALNESAKTLVYTFNTPVTNKQSSYMIDVSTILTAKNKVGALRHILKEGYPQEKIEENSPNRTSMNNRTTIKGEFKSENTGQWTITDAVSTGDTNNGLPLETRSLENQTLQTGKRAVYGINTTTGEMEVKTGEATISNVPSKETDPNGEQAVGNIGVYKFDTNLNTPNGPTDYSVGGVTISKYKDIIVDQHWSLADGYETMPAQDITIKANDGTELGKTTVNEETGYQRVITVPNVRFWNIGSGGQASMIDHKVDQPLLPSEFVTVDGKRYKFRENANYYDVNSKTHYITNALVENNDKTPATFTVIKVDANNPEKRISGANFYLLGAEIGITTDSNGEATFSNIKPGTYTLKETKAPTGYKLDQEGKTITISDEGEVSISGKNAQFSSGSGKTDILEHSDFPNWKDFMNTQHYGKVDENGNLKFYVYLKPYDQRVGGRTDKDTTLNISMPGVNLQDLNIKVYDVSPNKRPDIFAAMNNQSVDQKLSSLGQITLGEPNNSGAIEGKSNTQNPLSGNTCYQITLPQGRFGDNWGFLVEVSANIGDKDSTVLSYDWLAKDAPANQSKIRANVNLSKNSDENGHPTITISNEEFPKSEIEVAKFADTSTDGKKARLAGAEFVLKNENGEIIANKITDEKGNVSFGKYPTGTYYLEEEKAPEGYERSNVYFRVTVSEDGKVTYDAKFKDSDASPTAGVDYYIEREEGGQTEDTAIVTRVNQSMVINDDEGSGNFRGVWEAYRLESLKYHLDATISNAAPGSRFEIQFDPNLDFTQYFKTFPNLYFEGKMIAEPYFNYKTNLLTYVFNENSLSNGLTTFSIDLKGMIPSKFYATHSGDWNFTNTVAPNQSSGTIQGNAVENITVHADYDFYDKHTTVGKFPSQAYYFRDVYKADDGNWYVKAIGYYNPLGDYKTGNANKIWFNWKFANYQGANLKTWQGHYDPPYYLDDVKIYQTTIPPLKRYEAHRDYYTPVNDYMPLSFGVRPEQNPDIYSLVYHAQIDHTQAYNRSEGGFNLSYDPSKVTSSGPLYDKENPPLTISVPKINPKKDAYLIEQTFRIGDINEFNTHWRAFYMANGDEKGNRANSLNSSFSTGANDNYSKADQTGEQLPSFAKEVVGIINRKFVPGSFKITKLNEANHNEKLQGATFVLTDSDGNKIYRTSDQNGEVNFKDLAPGRYTLKEYKAPNNFEKSKTEWDVIVYNDGNVKITSTSIIGQGEEYTGKNTINIPVYNRPAGQKFRVYKKDGNGRPLAGAKFIISDPEGKDTNFPIEAESDKNGIVEFTGKPQENKDYILEEVEPPAGYNKLNKKWVLRRENGKTKIYTYSKSDGKEIKSILGEEGTHWVNVKERPTTGWSSYDNRLTGWVANSSEARYLGTRIVAINKDKNYVIQRYVINPEARKIGATTASIHRQALTDPNMDWFDENNFDQNNDIRVFTLDKPVSGLISDIRLADYNTTDISSGVTKEKELGKYSQPDRLKLSLPATDKPIVVDIKVKYQSELGGVGTGMDWLENNNNTFWKADYYERVTDMVVGDPTKREAGSIIGSYVGEGSLDVTNELKTYGFKIKKVKEGETNTAIPGAEFKLKGPDPSINERYMTTGADGMITFNNLKPGKYKLEEQKAAPGYQKTDETWTVTITQDGKSYIKSDKTSEESTNRVEKSEELAINRARYSLLDRIQTSDTNNTGLEIGPTLPDTRNPLGAGISKIDYEILNLKNAEKFKNQVEVTTSAEYLGNYQFKVRYDMKNITGSKLTNKQFSVHFNNNVTFEGGSTHTWKWNTAGEEGNPNNPDNASRWHSGYDSDSKIIGIRSNELSIDPGDTASIEFIVNVNSALASINLVDYIKYDNTKITPYPRARKRTVYKITYEAKGGTIITDPMDWSENGKLVEIKEVSPKIGYTKKSEPTVTNNETGRSITIRNDDKFLMPASDVTVSATFEANTYKVNKGKIENGSIKVPTSAKTDQVVNITDINPIDGYKLDKITVTDANGNPVEVTNNSFKMPAGNVTVNATFKKLAYRITKQNPINGDFEVPETAESGSTVTITLKPDKGYEKDTISVRGGAGAIPVNGNTFEMPASDVVVDVTFKPIPPKVFNITVDQAQNGSVSSNKQSAKENEEVILTVKANEGYELDKLLVNGKPVEVSNGKYKFTMPKENVKVSATFKKKPITPPEGSVEIPADGYKITNKQTGLDLKIIKRDNNDRRLEKAEFELERYTNKDYETKDDSFGKLYGVSDQNGYVTLKDEDGNPVSLPVGFYRLTETQSPSGYKKPQAPFDIEVYEEAGQLKAKYKSAEHTSYDYIRDKKSYDSEAVKIADNGIKYKSKITYINTESKTYIQRIYIDTRGYNGASDKINIQISPKHKREEIDFVPGPGGAKPPETIKEGIKTAYRSTYKITGAPNDDNNFADTVLNNYDLSKNDVTMLNTARWRPFDWGFDEDIMNLDKGGVYYIDVEGFYDDAILTGIDSKQNNKNTIPEEDLKKLELNFDFYDGARSFQQRVYKNGQLDWTDGKDLSDSYLGGNTALGYVGTDENGATVPTEEGLKQAPGQKYPNWLSKKGGRIHPPLDEAKRTRVSTSIDLQTLYSSKNYTEVPQDGMSVVNEAERYNVTFSKHGRDNPNDKVDSESVTTNRLEGAIFKLQKEIVNTYVDVEGSYVGSAFNGYFGFRNLEPGRYRLMEVKASEGYKPITDPLLYFTIKTVNTNSGEVVDPETGDTVDIKTVNVRFESKGTTYKLSNLQMVDPKDSTKKLNISEVDSKDIDIETSKIVNPKTDEEVLLKDMIVVGKEQFDEEGNLYYNEYPVKQIKIIPASSGYISLEYDNANGVYQYVPENKESEKDGKLIDFVTSATAKNMGKIINEKPGEGELTVKKVDQNGDAIEASNLLAGAKFKLTNLTNGSVTTKIVGEDGTILFDKLPIGNYRLEEVKSPDGYVNTNQVWNFTIGGEGLDPYAGPIARTGRNLSDKIKLNTTDMYVLNPEDKTRDNKINEIHPHYGESMEFTNKFEVDKNIKINPGDYFVLNMSDVTDLNGIADSEVENLDIIAAGIGTIAKADYDRQKRTITYTFTDYAKTYSLVEFSNKLTSFIDLYKLKQTDQGLSKQKVGFYIGNDYSQLRDMRVIYDLDYGHEEDIYGNRINLVSKIVKYNPETGEFLHYYYVNRLKENTAGPVELRYVSDQNIENFNMSVSYLRDNTNVANDMPESFAVNENSSNLTPFDTVRSFQRLNKGYYTSVKFNEGIYNTHSYIIKVTGRVAEKDKSEYTAHGTLLKFNYNYSPTYAERHDSVHYFVNEASGSVKPEIVAVNPENKILFKKVDQEGKALKGAKFKLKYKQKAVDDWSYVKEEITTGEDGKFEYTKLKPGFYQLEETSAPDGYNILTNPAYEFVVNINGKIIRKTAGEEKETEEDGIVPIYIENKKKQNISFEKVDASTKKALKDAKFEVWYKKNKSDEYSNKLLKLYEKTTDGKVERLVLKSDEKAPSEFSEVESFTSGDDGIVDFTFYESGYYALKEIKAPSGYITPKGYVKEFAAIDGKIQEEKYLTEMQVSKTKSWFYANGMNEVYNTDITMNINPDHEKITYEQGKSKITLSGLPLNSEYYENNISSKTGITINAKLVNKDKQNSSTKTYTVPLSQYGSDSKGNITIDLYELVKELEKKTGDSITSENTIELSMSSTLALSTVLDINSKIEIGDGDDKINEDRTFHIGTKGDEKVNHSYSFTTMEELSKKDDGKTYTPIQIENKKLSLPMTSGLRAWIGFTIIGLILMLLAAYYYNKKKNKGLDLEKNS
ncbi:MULTISPECIES: SpaA isopeptide-forming pilin-related protein [Anaerococcus]|uniref:SpaA isopeptide-forming pilin-related protein n=1 Tax=Anaerococcus TaxID=165779 RepID=UPI00242E2F7B|nr:MULTISPECIES: SpaA isopeptide-forming pilin-related protein [Anaerococcus]MDD7766904.1 SpaA isopeptide-forming pilin-related protein [Anaerococcus vaginalis]MDY6127303.1 SpaA isopeptide-forming pilin-related protein [Anaerococcus sp.]